MGKQAKLRLYNTLTRSKDDFEPIDPSDVRMYVCGPTVYDFAHIGNARPVIVFDVLFRLLRHLYGEDQVTYVRNITDVDDKINARARRDFPDLKLNEAIRRVTETTARQFHEDVAALGCLLPTVEPRATEFVLPRPDGKADMVSLIQTLIERGHAYEAPHSAGSGGEILFDTASMPDYGRLSRRNLDEQQAGARVAVDAHKKNPADFVLWKESSAEEPGWDAEFRLGDRTVTIRGRPGWHIECSAMSAAYLGEVFDIHGGGLDLIFPHHENEIAQSRCAHGTAVMANYWLHNGFLQVEGKKMAKSEGNFVTIHELLHTEKFGGRKWPGEVLRLAMLMTHYREPIDFSVRKLEEAENVLNKLRAYAAQRVHRILNRPLWDEFLLLLRNDLDTPSAIQTLLRALNERTERAEYTIYRAIKLLGFTGKKSQVRLIADKMVAARKALELLTKNQFDDLFISVERSPFFPSGTLKPESSILDELAKIAELGEIAGSRLERWKSQSYELRNYSFQFHSSEQLAPIQRQIDRRLGFIEAKNWHAADRIREELLAQGIQLKDGKDPETGERVTTWEVKR